MHKKKKKKKNKEGLGCLEWEAGRKPEQWAMKLDS